MQVNNQRRLTPIGSAIAGSSRPMVIAHRGATRAAAPNSIAAFEAAIQLGVDAVELDVRLTADGVPVVHHDATARGTPVARLSHQQLCLRRGSVPTLAEAVEVCAGRVGLDVEIKATGHERQVVEAALARVSRDDLMITSFIDSALAAVKQIDPGLPCGLLIGPTRLRSRPQRFAFEWMWGCGADFIAAHQLLAPPRRVRASRIVRRDTGLLPRAARAGVALVVWTVNRPDRLRRYLSDPRVAAVVTDIPEIALQIRDAAEAPPEAVTRRSHRPFPGRVRARLRR